MSLSKSVSAQVSALLSAQVSVPLLALMSALVLTPSQTHATLWIDTFEGACQPMA